MDDMARKWILAAVFSAAAMAGMAEPVFFYAEDDDAVLESVNLNGATAVVIPDNVTEIGQFAFAGCAAMKSVVIPEGVERIGEGAFYMCSGLTSVTIPDSVTSIGNSTF